MVLPATTASPSLNSAAATRPETRDATVVAMFGSMVPMKKTSSGTSADSTEATLTATGPAPQPWAGASASHRNAASRQPAARAMKAEGRAGENLEFLSN